MKEEIEAKLIWLPKRKFSVIKEKLSHLGVQVTQLEEIPRIYDYYEEEQNVLKCKLMLPQSLKDFKQTFIERWCSQDFGNDQAWITLKESNAFDTFNRLNDHEIIIHNFSFGTMVGLNNLIEHYDTAKQNDKKNSLEYKITQIKGNFEHDCKRMVIYFIVTKKNLKDEKPSADTHLLHKFEIKYSDIYRIIVNKIRGKMMDVCFYLTYPILLYMVQKSEKNAKEDYDEKHNYYTNFNNLTPYTKYTRKPNFPHCSSSDIGLSNILKLEFPWEKSWDVVSLLVNNCPEADCFYSSLKKIERPKSYPIPQISSNNFNCLYALKCILSKTRDVSVQIYLKNALKSINDKLNKYVSENPTALETALLEINAALERKNIVIFENALDFLYNKYKEYDDEIINGNGKTLVKVRRAILTPTRIIFLPSQYYFRCRFFRQFDAEYALRVSVRDDNYEKLSFSFRGDHSEFNKAIDVIKKDLLKGFKIGERHYKILGCSTSHLRDHGIMFYANKDIKDILSKLGQFDKIKCVSKYMARMGQVFSQAIEAITVDKNKTEDCNDITVESEHSKEEYEFSDGIGMLSSALAKQAFKKLEITDNPSAIQIRYAGYKGMLTVWPEHIKNNKEVNLKGEKIIFRKSMKKFDSESNSLEILKVSKPRLVFLNRHFITILSHLGIADSKFLDLQKCMLEKSLKSFIYEEDARDMLKENCSFHINYNAIHKFGIEILHEPFFLSLLKAIFFKQIEGLKEKTRILIPPDKGRTMFGVLDETRQLKYGQVFVQYTKDIWNEEDRSLVILEGEILVTKNPCMHPGDVRKFQAVDIPELRHIKDCIVFPAQGKRPHPNEMAGSDLDGDEYSVIWMEELVFNCDNHPPMDFPKQKVEELDRSVEVEDMVNFFCRFIRESNLGKLANAHLAWSDIENDGVLSKKCIEIAKKYAKCLDFAKTGVNESLSPDECVNVYPDFFDKKIEKDSYRSTKILGQLYRCSKTVQLGFKEFIESDSYNTNYNYFILDHDLIYPENEIYTKSAIKAYKKYKNKVETMLTQYGIQTEAELLSGSICKMHKYMTESQELNDLQLIEHRVKMLIREMRRDFVREFVNDDAYNTDTLMDDLYGSANKEKVFQKASAWYKITHDESQRNSEKDKEIKKHYFGLPWTLADVLSTMKRDRSNNRKNVSRKQIFEQRLRKSLEQTFPSVFETPIEDRENLAQVVFNIMHKWINDEILNSSNLSEKFEMSNDLISELLTYMFEEMPNSAINSDDDEISITRTLMTFLERLSCLMMQRNAFRSTSFVVPYILNNQFLGQLAFKIFLNLVCSRNTDCFKAVNADIKLEERDVKATFRLQLIDDDLSERFCRFENEVKELLLEWTKLREISYRPVKERGNKWIAIITVRGNVHAVNYFQDMIISDDFKSSIIDSIPVD